MATETQNPSKSKVGDLSPGDKWSRHSYGQVVRPNTHSVIVKNEGGLEWSIDANLFEKEFNVAGQFQTVEKLNRTEMVEKIVSAARLVMTVHFRKKPDHKALVETVTRLLDGERDFPDVSSVERPKPRALSKLLKDATAGEERTMIGRHYGTSDDFGRLQFTAMETGGGLRLIDPRTVEWAIIDNVKYELK